MFFSGARSPTRALLRQRLEAWDADAGGWWDVRRYGGVPAVRRSSRSADVLTVIRTRESWPPHRAAACGCSPVAARVPGTTSRATRDALHDRRFATVSNNITETTYDFEPECSAPIVSDVATTPKPVKRSRHRRADGDRRRLGDGWLQHRVGRLQGRIPGSWLPMTATDGTFDGVTEDVQATISGLAVGTYNVCVRGTDAANNTSAGTDCTTVHVLSMPSITIHSVGPVLEGNFGNKTVNISVTLSGAGAQAIDVHWATGGGTATPGADYVAGSGNLHWNAGDATSRTDPRLDARAT